MTVKELIDALSLLPQGYAVTPRDSQYGDVAIAQVYVIQLKPDENNTTQGFVRIRTN